MTQLKLGFVGEIGGGKTESTAYVKKLYPGTSSVRFSDSLREFIAWFNDRKMAGVFTIDLDQVEHALEEELCAIFPRSMVSRVSNKAKLVIFTDWVVHEWLCDEGEVSIDRVSMQKLSTALRAIFGEDILCTKKTGRGCLS